MITTALWLSLLAQDTDRVTLEWKFKKGESVRYEMGISVGADVGEEGSFASDTLFGFKMDADDVDDKGVTQLKMTYDRVKVKMSGPMDSDYDSDRDKAAPDDMTGRFMAAFVGKSFTMKMNPKGEILEVKGLDKLLEEVVKELGDEGDMMGEMLLQMYGEDQMKQMMQNSMGILPGKPVAKGDSWESNSEFGIPNMGSMKMKNKATLKEIRAEQKQAVVGMDTKIEIQADDENAMMELKDASMKSEFVWRTDLGRLESGTSTLKITMSAGEQEIPMEMKMQMKLAPRDKKEY